MAGCAPAERLTTRASGAASTGRQTHLGPDLDARAWFEHILVLANLVVGDPMTEAVCEDQDDDKYLAAALEGGAQHVVTGDRPFLSRQEYQDVRVVSPRTLPAILDAS